MALTPVEIRHLAPKKTAIGGYDRDAVDGLLAEIVASFEDVWRERADLADKVEQLESDLGRFRELEGLLRTTLISAERGAGDHAERARRPRSAADRGPPDAVAVAVCARTRR